MIQKLIVFLVFVLQALVVVQGHFTRGGAEDSLTAEHEEATSSFLQRVYNGGDELQRQITESELLKEYPFLSETLVVDNFYPRGWLSWLRHPANSWTKNYPESACSGKEQSPINICTKSDMVMDNTNIPSKIVPSSNENVLKEIVNNGNSIQFNIDKGSWIELFDRVDADIVGGKKKYQLKQMHFHWGAEHTIDKKRYEGEMHLVHISDDGNIAVIGAMIDTGDENPLLASVFDFIPKDHTKDNVVQIGKSDFNLYEDLDLEGGFWMYNGSLTTPPCTEGVLWTVLKQGITFSSEQLKKIKSIVHKNNYRPVQPLNDRPVFQSV